MISVVTWVWEGPRRYRPMHANTLYSMLCRHLHVPFRFICISSYAEGFVEGVEVLPIPAAAKAVGDIMSPEGEHMPSCYRRLWVFSDEARMLGERVLSIDVDLVILDDITPVVQRDEEFVGWKPRQNWGNADRVAGGMFLLTTGTRTHVWDDFGPDEIRRVRKLGYRGSDQAWMSYKLAKDAALWRQEDGLYALSDIEKRNGKVPEDARIVQFAGIKKPWHCMNLDWVQQHYT